MLSIVEEIMHCLLSLKAVAPAALPISFCFAVKAVMLLSSSLNLILSN